MQLRSEVVNNYCNIIKIYKLEIMMTGNDFCVRCNYSWNNWNGRENR